MRLKRGGDEPHKRRNPTRGDELVVALDSGLEASLLLFHFWKVEFFVPFLILFFY